MGLEVLKGSKLGHWNGESWLIRIYDQQRGFGYCDLGAPPILKEGEVQLRALQAEG